MTPGGRRALELEQRRRSDANTGAHDEGRPAPMPAYDEGLARETAEQRALRRAEAARTLQDVDTETLRAAEAGARRRADNARPRHDAGSPHRIAAELGWRDIRDELERRQLESTAAAIESTQFMPDDARPRYQTADELEHLEPWLVTETPHDPPAGLFWHGKARDALHALDLFAEQEGFAPYSTQLETPEGAELVGEEAAPNGARWAIFTNTTVYALRGELEHGAYRLEIRGTLQRMSDAALAHQDSVIRGGIDREELERELTRRQGSHVTRTPIPGEPSSGAAPAAPADVVLELTRDEAGLLAAIVDFGGVDNDNLSSLERSTAEAIADTLRAALNRG